MTYNMYPANWGGDHERQYADPGLDWLSEARERSLGHLRALQALDPTLLSPVARELLADADARDAAAEQDEAPVKRYCQQCGFWESEHGTGHPFVANDPVGEIHEEPVDWEARAKAVEDLFADVNWLRLTLQTPLHVLRDKVLALLRGEA